MSESEARVTKVPVLITSRMSRPKRVTFQTRTRSTFRRAASRRMRSKSGAPLASGSRFSLLHLDALVGQALGDRLVDPVHGPCDSAAGGARLGDDGPAELGADAVLVAAWIAGARSRHQRVKLVFGCLAVARDAEV